MISPSPFSFFPPPFGTKTKKCCFFDRFFPPPFLFPLFSSWISTTSHANHDRPPPFLSLPPLPSLSLPGWAWRYKDLAGRPFFLPPFPSYGYRWKGQATPSSPPFSPPFPPPPLPFPPPYWLAKGEIVKTATFAGFSSSPFFPLFFFPFFI